MFEAIVNGNGTFYADGPERLYLHINKTGATDLPYEDGVRVPVTLVIGGIEYKASLCSRSDYQYVYVATGLTDPTGVERKLTYILQDQGLDKGQRVRLSMTGNRITLV